MLINLKTSTKYLKKITKNIYATTSQKRTKSPIETVNDINLDAKKIAQKLEIDERVEKMHLLLPIYKRYFDKENLFNKYIEFLEKLSNIVKRKI